MEAVADDFVACDDRKRAHVRCCTEALMRAEKTGTNERVRAHVYARRYKKKPCHR